MSSGRSGERCAPDQVRVPERRCVVVANYGKPTALVTGANGGIGTEIVAALLAAGYMVHAGVRTLERGEQLRERFVGESLSLVELEVTDASSVRKACSDAAGVGGLDLVVNNAGHNEVCRFADSDEARWRYIIDVNLIGAMRVLRECYPALKSRSGTAVNITSESAVAGSAGEVPYSAAKAGLSAATRALAREWARDGIRVNAVSPGPIETDMLLDMVGSDSAERSRRVEKMLKIVPLHRLGTGAEIAAAVVFLASPGAGFITGQVLHVGGGVTMQA